MSYSYRQVTEICFVNSEVFSFYSYKGVKFNVKSSKIKAVYVSKEGHVKMKSGRTC